MKETSPSRQPFPREPYGSEKTLTTLVEPLWSPISRMDSSLRWNDRSVGARVFARPLPSPARAGFFVLVRICYTANILMRRLDLLFTALQVPTDLFALIAAATTAFILRLSQPFLEVRPILQELTFGEYAASSSLFILVWMLCFWLAGLYPAKPRPLWEEFSRILLGSTAGMMAMIASVFFQRELTTSRFIVLALWGLTIVYVWLGRLALRGLRAWFASQGMGHRRIAVIGSSNAAAALKVLYAKKRSLGYTVIASFKSWNASAQEELLALSEKHAIDGVLLADPKTSKEQALDLIAFTEERHLQFRYLADLFAAKFTRIDITTEAGIPIIEPKPTPLDGWGRIAKRVFDLTGSSILLVLTSPIMLVAAIAIKLDSEGTVLFSHLPDGSPVERMGEHGRPFSYFKFRSMKMDTHHQRYNELAKKNLRKDGPLVKIAHDPRVTNVGRFIREWSIDELPELALVFLGRMSLVGPRPHYPEEVERYKPEQRRVLAIKPGITGMAQVSGRSDLTFEEEVRLDTWYIEHWSLWLDLVVLLKTPFAVFGHRGVERGA